MASSRKRSFIDDEKLVLRLAVLHSKLVEIRSDIYMADNKAAIIKINEMIEPLEENHLNFLNY